MGLFGLPEIAGCQLQRYPMAVPTVATRPIFLRILWKNCQSPSSPYSSHLVVPQSLTLSLGNKRLKKLSNRKKM